MSCLKIDLFSPPGSGKTHFACCFAEAITAVGDNWQFSGISKEMRSRLRELKITGQSGKTPATKIKSIKGTDEQLVLRNVNNGNRICLRSPAGEIIPTNDIGILTDVRCEASDVFILVLNPFSLLKDQSARTSLIYELARVLQPGLRQNNPGCDCGGEAVWLAAAWLGGQTDGNGRITDEEKEQLRMIELVGGNNALAMPVGGDPAVFARVQALQQELSKPITDLQQHFGACSNLIDGCQRMRKPVYIAFSRFDLLSMLGEQRMTSLKAECRAEALRRIPNLGSVGDAHWWCPEWMEIQASGKTLIQTLAPADRPRIQAWLKQIESAREWMEPVKWPAALVILLTAITTAPMVAMNGDRAAPIVAINWDKASGLGILVWTVLSSIFATTFMSRVLAWLPALSVIAFMLGDQKPSYPLAALLILIPHPMYFWLSGFKSNSRPPE